MSQSVPPAGNPFADGAAVPPAPAPAPVRNNVALGLAAAVVAALVTAGVYGAILGATEYEIGFAAVGVGFVIGFAAGKLGGSNPVLSVVSALLALGAVYLGQLLGIAIIFDKIANAGVLTMFTENLSVLTAGWKEGADPMTYLFLAIGGFVAFSSAKKAS
ncbi:hypothetical protein [Streptomyces sp. SYSU K21746]